MVANFLAHSYCRWIPHAVSDKILHVILAAKPWCSVWDLRAYYMVFLQYLLAHFYLVLNIAQLFLLVN